ncbi:MAG: aldehyde dehydrogenase EutE [Anaerolineales bacterium]|jgi:acyl-CoA reductase-like NAD-dependent aldehyde dehydrogenase
MLDEARIEAIVQQVMAELRQGERVRHGPAIEPSATSQPPAPAPTLRHADNLFPDVDSAIAAARAAYQQLLQMPLSIRDSMISHMRRVMRENAQLLAQEAWQETGMGRYEDKIQKNLLNANKTPGTEILQPIAWTGDDGLSLIEYAPYGVIGAIIPSTNPTSTVICNAIGMVAAGNAAVFNAHPGATMCSNHAVQLMNDAIIEAGGPANLVCAIAKPTIETAQQIMAHSDIDILTVTGGAGVVKAAMQSGKRAVCAGPGNPPVVVDETADLEQAGQGIVRGASFDNNIICIDEKQVFAVASITDELKRVMIRNGAYEIDSAQLDQLMKVIFKEIPPRGQHGYMNTAFIGKNAGVLLEQIGIQVGDEIRLVIVEVEADHPLVMSEQMMPILPIVRVRDADEGIDLSKVSEHGFRHTAVMYSKNIDSLSRMAREMDCSIFVKNGPSYAGLGHGGEGFCSFTIASPTGEGITNPISFSRIRRCVLKDHFRIV